MSMVRRCDYAGCTNGPAGTPAVSAEANPDGWIVASSSPLFGDPQAARLDFDTALCAAQQLFGLEVDVAEQGTMAALKAAPAVKA